MSSVTLFNLLGNATTGGTWSRVSATGPAAPNTYNGSIDFATPTLFASGSYVYRYTVTVNSVTATSDVTVIWQGVAPDRVNDTCATAFEIGGTANTTKGFEVIVEDDNLDNCPVVKAPNVPNPTDYPAAWNQGTYSGDLWYKFVFPNRSFPYIITIALDSTGFTEDAAEGFALQLKKNVSNSSCASDVEVTSVASNKDGKQLSVTFDVAASQSYTLRFRVASIKQGKFYINLKMYC